jgi:uncharacterized membrane protein YfcA
MNISFISIAWLFAFDALEPVTSKSTLSQSHERLKAMGKRIAVILYVVAMASVIVGVDLVFFRDRFWERLIVNIGIVLVFGAFYMRFLMPS